MSLKQDGNAHPLLPVENLICLLPFLPHPDRGSQCGGMKDPPEASRVQAEQRAEQRSRVMAPKMENKSVSPSPLPRSHSCDFTIPIQQRE